MHYDTGDSIFIPTFSIPDTDPHLRPGESLPSGELAEDGLTGNQIGRL